MKKRIILLSIIGLFLLAFSFNYIQVKADSGWDSDYDSGGSWDSGSDWDSDDYGWSGSYWDGDSNDISFSGIVIVLVIVVIVVLANRNKISNFSRGTNGSSINNITNRFTYVEENTIKEKIPGFNKAEFLKTAYQNFLDVQDAWSNFEYDKLRELLSDELFNTYQSQLKALKLKKQQNIMSDFIQDFIEIKGFEYIDGKATINVVLLVSFYDYVVNAKGVVLRGNKSVKMNNAYELTFICSEAKTNKAKKCPSCNAPLDDKVTNKCPYCGSKIIHSTYDWVLSKKEAFSRYNK